MKIQPYPPEDHSELWKLPTGEIKYYDKEVEGWLKLTYWKYLWINGLLALLGVSLGMIAVVTYWVIFGEGREDIRVSVLYTLTLWFMVWVVYLVGTRIKYNRL